MIDNVNHKIIESNLDFYLEEISESTRNTKRVKELRAIKNNQIFHVRQNSTQRFYQYRIDKIGQHKAYLRCVNYKCCSRLEVILGFNLKTEKIGNNFQFHEDVTEEMLKDTNNYQGLNHKCTKKCTGPNKKCTTHHKCSGYGCNMVHYRNHRANSRQARERLEDVSDSITYADVKLRNQTKPGTLFSDLNVIESATQWSLSYLDRTMGFSADNYSTLNWVEGQKEHEEEIFYESENIKIILLPSNLHLLNYAHVFVDGTFRTVSSARVDGKKAFHQMYVCSVRLTSVDDRSFVLPIWYAFLPNKQRKTYDEMWKLFKSIWNDKMDGEPFRPYSFNLDFEIAAIKSIEAAFTASDYYPLIRLCSVHMLRNWCKHWKRIGKKIWKTPEFHNVWQILRGCPYIPWNDDLVNCLFGYLRAQQCQSKKMNENYQKFLDYLYKEYFTAFSGKKQQVNVLGYLNWQHPKFILKTGEVDSTTNVAETVNAAMKHKIKSPPQTLTRLFMGIKKFHFYMMNERKAWGKTKSKGKRKKHIVEKHNIMRDLISEYHDLSETEQKNTLISYCLKLSGARQIVYKKDYDEPCDSDADYDSDPEPETEPDYDCYPDSE